MKSVFICLSTLLLATSLPAETATLWLTLNEKLIGPAVSWDGFARASDGGIVTVRGWLFEDTDKLDGASWQAAARCRTPTATRWTAPVSTGWPSATTTKISIQVRIGDHPQGSEIELAAAPKIEANLAAPAPIALVQIVRDGQFIYSAKPDRPTVTLSFTDPDLKPGQSAYYYVRAQLGADDLAWTSPIWVSRKP
ncbi:MAG: hypothetical protein N2689_02945 [Verrucomicrobiae bacterium]|nr:hypothetical protein [Verrucomicrobiae bacterium]